MPFDFDPFATTTASTSTRPAKEGSASPPPSTPAPLISTAPAPNPAPPVIVNPFDNFSFTSSNARNNNANGRAGAAGNNNNDWQQTARAAMSSGNGVWKNASSKMMLGGSGTQSASFQDPGNSSINNSNPPTVPKQPKRIVPYTSPISTLESNWDPWSYAAQSSSPQSLWTNGGNSTTYLIVRANDACCLSGGVESVLKWSKSRPEGRSMMGIEAELGNFDSTLSLSESQNDNGASSINYGIAHSPISDSVSASSSGRTKPLGSSVGGGGLGGMRFLKSGLKKAQQSIERSVTTMAIKADGGKNPDQLCVSLHYLGGMNMVNNGANPHTVNLNMYNALGINNNGVVGGGIMQDVGDVCLSRTEWVELPTAVDSGDLLFSIPLCVPDLSFLEAAAAGPNGAAGQSGSSRGNNGDCGVKLTVRLYIRSGATLLKAVANREYCIGESALLYTNLMQLMSGSGQKQSTNNGNKYSNGNGALRSGTINVPFTTGMLAETSNSSLNSFGSCSSIHSSGGGDAPAALHITATPRVKFNPPCTYGWSLTDPASTPPTGRKNWLKMFQLPLDQAYAFNLVHHHQLLNTNQQYPNQQLSDATVLLANERAVESALVLPLATACSLLFSSAASLSQQLAASAATKMHSKRALYLPTPSEETRSKLEVDGVVMTAMRDGCADVELGVVALVLLGEGTQMDFGLLSGCGVGFESAVPSVKTTLSFQPPHTIFEEPLISGSCPLLDEASGTQYINSLNGPSSAGVIPEGAIATRFLPRILNGSDDLLPGLAGSRQNDRYLGSIRLEVKVGYANSAVDNISTGISRGTAVEGLVELEHYMDAGVGGSGCGQVPVLAPAIDAITGRRIGTFVLLLRVATANNGKHTPSSPQHGSGTAAGNDSTNGASSSTTSGLVSVVGLPTLTEDLGLAPYMDCDPPPPNSQLAVSPPTAAGIRRRQVATMGSFVSNRFLEYQANVVRKRDASVLKKRYDEYHQSLLEESDVEGEADLPLFQRRSPRPFRPSNSRGDAMLAGIGFNVHVQSLALNILQENGNQARQAAVTQSVTHGAPADHARGFGEKSNNGGDASAGVIDSSKDGAPRGGLRRLESTRLEFAKDLDDSVTGLISAVGEHFKSRANRNRAGVKPSRHIPPNLPSIIHYRTKSVECTQRLHSLTWDIAVRRANCFSQALGIAVTSYLASLSDGGPAWRGYAAIWARHGYLLTYEGLLSAVGKELGMIEDASVAISMLRMVSVVLMPDDPNSNNNGRRQRIPVPYSPYLRWVHLIHLATPSQNGSNSKTQYRLEIGLDPSFFQSRVPDPLKNGTPVRFFPILFQMGVDIRQWGVNAGRSVALIQMKDNNSSKRGHVTMGDAADPSMETSTGENNQMTTSGHGGSLLDDEDDDGDGEDSIPDNEIHMALNVEGYRKLNAYAHSVNPTNGVTAAAAPPPVFDSLEYSAQMQVPQQQPIHPSLVSLSEAIRTSAGKMEHAVMDQAATICQRFGGGSTVFCKSGKDRTAMQVTFKQSQFVQRFIDKKEVRVVLEDTPVSSNDVFAKSTLMRKHGNRIPICEKNAGEPKFAFNPLQRKFMPEMLRPDASLCTWSKPET